MPSLVPESTRLEKLALEMDSGGSFVVTYVCESCGLSCRRKVTVEDVNDTEKEGLGIDPEDVIETNSDPDEL